MSRRRKCCTLPSALRGSSAANTISRGSLKRASCHQKPAQLVRADRRAGAAHHDGQRHLQPSRVGHADHRRLRHRRMVQQHALDLRGIDAPPTRSSSCGPGWRRSRRCRGVQRCRLFGTTRRAAPSWSPPGFSQYSLKTFGPRTTTSPKRPGGTSLAGVVHHARLAKQARQTGRPIARQIAAEPACTPRSAGLGGAVHLQHRHAARGDRIDLRLRHQRGSGGDRAQARKIGLSGAPAAPGWSPAPAPSGRGDPARSRAVIIGGEPRMQRDRRAEVQRGRRPGCSARRHETSPAGQHEFVCVIACMCWLTPLHSSACCVSTAPFGRPVVPAAARADRHAAHARHRCPDAMRGTARPRSRLTIRSSGSTPASGCAPYERIRDEQRLHSASRRMSSGARGPASSAAPASRPVAHMHKAARDSRARSTQAPRPDRRVAAAELRLHRARQRGDAVGQNP